MLFMLADADKSRTCLGPTRNRVAQLLRSDQRKALIQRQEIAYKAPSGEGLERAFWHRWEFAHDAPFKKNPDGRFMLVATRFLTMFSRSLIF